MCVKDGNLSWNVEHDNFVVGCRLTLTSASCYNMYADGFQDDEHTGEIIYGYVLDSCGDNNFWCQNDPGHLDLSTPYLQSLGLIGEHFNARKSSWSFMDGAPPGYDTIYTFSIMRTDRGSCKLCSVTVENSLAYDAIPNDLHMNNIRACSVKEISLNTS